MTPTGTVLIIAPSDDVHALAVAERLQEDFHTDALIWDTASFPIDATVSYSPDRSEAEFRGQGSVPTFEFDSLKSIWWRRPSPFSISESVNDEPARSFCQRECRSLLRAILDICLCRVVNDPDAQTAASRKPRQLQLAHELGLLVPRTLIGNDQQAVRSFWERSEGRCIYKPLTAPRGQLAETRVLTRADLADLGTLSHAPVIVQQLIEKGRDIRVSIFGAQVFAAAVTTTHGSAHLDWRLDMTAMWEPHELPAVLRDKLIKLVDLLGLKYGCVDLRQQPDGSYVFFEINPAGQFLFIEIDTGLPLSTAMAATLIQD